MVDLRSINLDFFIVTKAKVSPLVEILPVFPYEFRHFFIYLDPTPDKCQSLIIHPMIPPPYVHKFSIQVTFLRIASSRSILSIASIVAFQSRSFRLIDRNPVYKDFFFYTRCFSKFFNENLSNDVIVLRSNIIASNS